MCFNENNLEENVFMKTPSNTQPAKKRTSILAKLLLSLLTAVAAAIIIILLIVYNAGANILLSRSETILSKSSDSVVNQINGMVQENLAALKAQRTALEYHSPKTSADTLSFLKTTANQYDAFSNGMYIGYTNGKFLGVTFTPDASYDPRVRDWYKVGIQSDDFTLGPAYLDADTKSYVVSASAKLKDKNGNVKGVAAADISLSAITKMIKPITIETTGGAFLVDTKTNTVIGAKEDSAVGVTLDKQTNGMYQFVANALKQKKTGIITYGSGNDSIYMDVAAIPNSSWTAVSYVPKNEIMSALDTLTHTLVIIASLSILILIALITLLVGRMVNKPVKELDSVARKIAEGQLNEKITFQSNDEFGELAFNFNKTVTRLRDYVDEIADVLNEIANRNLNFNLKYDYAGEFSKVKVSLQNISESLSTTIRTIQQSAEQVASGSDQVSAGAQALSQGATEQASSVEELAATIDEISIQVRDNADKALHANASMKTVNSQLLESNSQMQEMIHAMSDISSSSDQISKIIKTIEDIAFQTNILALNAAVEAARAGEAGKGFSVVADEVRNLASKSAAASQSTSELIERSLQAVAHGSQIADETAKSLLNAVNGTNETAESINKIAETSHNQSDSITQITQGIDQISSVVQTTSATSEESAAASEELSGQAQMLKDMVEQFQLSGETAAAVSVTASSTASVPTTIDNSADYDGVSQMNTSSKY